MPGVYFDTLERIDIGPRVREEDFDTAILPRACKLAKKYDISTIVLSRCRTMTRWPTACSQPVWFAVETGLWVLDTQRVIRFTEAEIWRRLDNLDTPLVFGYGKDQVVLLPRKPESSVRPLVIGGQPVPAWARANST